MIPYSKKWQKWIDIALVVLVIYTIAHIAYTFIKYNYYIGGDFDVQFEKAKAWVEKGELPWWGWYTYPFFYHILLRPLTHFSLENVRPVMYVITILLFASSVYVLAKCFSKNKIRRRDWLFLFVVSANYWPALETITQFKVEMIELFLIALAIYFLKKHKDYVVGTLITIAANLKYFPGVLLLYFFYKRERKIIISAIAAMTVIVAVLLLSAGTENVLAFFKTLPERFATVSEGVDPFLITNVAISGAILRMFAVMPSEEPVIVHSALAHSIALAVRIGSLLILAYLFRKKIKDRSSRQLDIELCLALLSIFFIAPYTLNGYAILLLPAFVFAYFYMKENWQWLKLNIIVSFAISYVLIGFFLPLGLVHVLPKIPYFSRNDFAVWWYSVPTIGFLILGYALVAIGNWRKQHA